MIVQLRRRSARYPDLTPGQPYHVVGIEADDYRLLNDAGRPYLYPAKLFDVLDARRPDDWQEERGGDREEYAYPPELSTPGFFEDYFDGKRAAVATFWRVMNRELAATG